MVLWCKCGTFMGLREPLKNWTADRTGICQNCIENQYKMESLRRQGIDLEVPAIKAVDKHATHLAVMAPDAD
jgi:hypothetical protein